MYIGLRVKYQLFYFSGLMKVELLSKDFFEKIIKYKVSLNPSIGGRVPCEWTDRLVEVDRQTDRQA